MTDWSKEFSNMGLMFSFPIDIFRHVCNGTKTCHLYIYVDIYDLKIAIEKSP